MRSCSSSTLCLLPSKQMAETSPSTEIGMHNVIPSRVPAQDISFLYHQGRCLSSAGSGPPRQRIAGPHRRLHRSFLAPESSSYPFQHLIVLLFCNCLDDIAMNIGDAAVRQRIIVIKFESFRGLICHVVTFFCRILLLQNNPCRSSKCFTVRLEQPSFAFTDRHVSFGAWPRADGPGARKANPSFAI
jgi:hypothetical protein